MRRIFWWTGVGVAVVGLAVAAALYWRHATLYPSTDDAYVGAHVVHVAAQVTGSVQSLHVRDHQRVHAGDPLFDLDPHSFQLAVEQDQARLALARQQVAADAAAVQAAAAAVNNREVLLQNARDNERRVRRLAARGYASHQERDDAQAALRSARAQLALARANLNQARKQLGGEGERNERVREAVAALGEAQVSLSDTHVSAPCDGRVDKLSLRPGDVVQANQPLFALICSREFWVDANFKETKLGRIRAGQPADVHVDMYPGHAFHGRVEAIAGASGVAFSLLPPENATGNWVKVTQRVPVRVLITDGDPAFPLRVGTSAEVTVDTTGLHVRR